MAVKVAEFLETISPHGSGKGTSKFLTPNSFYLIDQQKITRSSQNKCTIQRLDANDRQGPLIYKIKSPTASPVDPWSDMDQGPKW